MQIHVQVFSHRARIAFGYTGTGTGSGSNPGIKVRLPIYKIQVEIYKLSRRYRCRYTRTAI